MVREARGRSHSTGASRSPHWIKTKQNPHTAVTATIRTADGRAPGSPGAGSPWAIRCNRPRR